MIWFEPSYTEVYPVQPPLFVVISRSSFFTSRGGQEEGDMCGPPHASCMWSSAREKTFSLSYFYFLGRLAIIICSSLDVRFTMILHLVKYRANYLQYNTFLSNVSYHLDQSLLFLWFLRSPYYIFPVVPSGLAFPITSFVLACKASRRIACS